MSPLLLAFLSIFLIIGKSIASDQGVVKGLNVEKYMGRWYEIASFPTIFQPSTSVNTRANYTLRHDGKINVLNEAWDNGKRISIEGYAYKADPKSDEAKLKVVFKVFLLPIAGDYWVLYVDDKYHHALVGNPWKRNLWILSRETHLDEEIYNRLVAKAAEQGYDVRKLRKTPQQDPPPASEDAATDAN